MRARDILGAVSVMLLVGCPFRDRVALLDLGTREIVAATASVETDPAVAFSGTSDRHLVAYLEGSNVVATLVDLFGAPIGAPIPLSVNANLKGAPDVAWSSNANLFLVVWAEDLGAAAGYEVYGQLVDPAAGTVAGAVIDLTKGDAADQTQPAVAYSIDSNLFLVVWTDGRSGSGDIFGQRLDGTNGADVGANFQISTDAEGEKRPDLAWQRFDDEFMVVFERDDGFNEDDIVAQRVRDSGTLNGADVFIADEAEDLDSPAIAYSEDSNHYCVAYKHDSLPDHLDAVLVEENGVVFALRFAGANDDDDHPAVAWSDRSEEFLVAFDLNDAGNEEVFSRLMDDFSGGTSTLVGLARGSADQRTPALSYDDRSQSFLVVWEDEGDIFARTAD